jgi:hypothetical protein
MSCNKKITAGSGDQIADNRRLYVDRIHRRTRYSLLFSYPSALGRPWGAFLLLTSSHTVTHHADFDVDPGFHIFQHIASPWNASRGQHPASGLPELRYVLSLTSSSQDDWRQSTMSCPWSPPRQLRAQFSIRRPSTLANSFSLLVTRVRPCDFACAASSRSIGPTGFPPASSNARIRPYSTDAS